MMNRKLTLEKIRSLKELYPSGFSCYAIAKRLNVHPSTVWRALVKQNIEIRDLSLAAIEAVKAGRMKKHRIPKNLELNENLSYILGVLAGDGYLDYSNKRMTWQIALEATDKEFVKEFEKTLFDFFNIRPTFRVRKIRKINWRRQYVTKLCSKEACEYINSIGDFKHDLWRIPLIIKSSDDSIKISFLRGFFDSEGEIDKKIGRVGAVSINLNGLKEIGILLNDLNLRYTIISRKDLRLNVSQKYILRIHDKNSIKSFYDLIGFTIKRKQKILSNFVKNKFPKNREVRCSR